MGDSIIFCYVSEIIKLLEKGDIIQLAADPSCTFGPVQLEDDIIPSIANS